MTFTRVHTYVYFADPNLRCDECGEPVARFHDPERCGCNKPFENDPCGHTGVTSDCPSWGPVDGCRCDGHPHCDRAALAAADPEPPRVRWADDADDVNTPVSRVAIAADPEAQP